MSNIKKNLGLQTLYQVLSACTPLITAPYLSRKLGASELGVFSFTSSIIAYFTVFAMLGTVNYGTRCIAASGNNRSKRSKLFSSIFLFQVFVTLVCMILYCIYLFFFCHENQIIAILQGIALVSCFFDISWLFFGVEDFQVTVTNNIVIKVITVVLILFLVRKETDLWIYTIIMQGGTLLSNVVLFFYLPRYASLCRVSFSQIKEHIFPNLVLFVPILAMSVYHTMDKTMLGALSSYEQSGFYYNADKIVQIPLLIINGIGTVMLPHISALLLEKKQKESDTLFIITLEGIASLSIAMAFGIAAIAKEFIPIFYGPGYNDCIVITIIFTPILLAKSFSVIVRTQYLIPMGMEKELTKPVLVGAIVNLILNFILIPSYGAKGAAIATVFAEFTSCIFQFSSLHGKGLDIKGILVKTLVYINIGFFMLLIVRIIAKLPLNNAVLKLVIEIMIGAIFYIVTCLLFWKVSNNKFYELVIKKGLCKTKTYAKS